jgi:hypothetical protein
MPTVNGRRQYWTESQKEAVLLRAAEIYSRRESNKFKLWDAVGMAQSQLLDKESHRPIYSGMGIHVFNPLRKLVAMPQAERTAYATRCGLSKYLLAEEQKPATQTAATAVAATHTQPAQLHPQTSTEPTGEISTLEDQLAEAVSAYAARIIQPVMDQALERLVTQFKPRLMAAVQAQLGTVIQDALATKVHEYRTKGLPASFEETLAAAATLQGIAPVEVPAAKPQQQAPNSALRLTDTWQEGDNIVIFGLLPAQFAVIENQLKQYSWWEDLKIRHVKELNELHAVSNSRTHLIHVIKFSAHLPVDFRKKIAYIYPKANGIEAVTETIKGIIVGDRRVDYY